MEFCLKPFTSLHSKEVIDIFNYYVENSLSAYPSEPLPYEFFDRFLEMTKGYPAYVIVSDEKVSGFGFLHAYNPFPSFKGCAEISYFILPEYTGKGLGSFLFERLIAEAEHMDISVILASISSENVQSINFHKKHGFRECGRFEKIVSKKGKTFDVIWMQKDLTP